MNTPLYRSRSDVMIAGVCGGLADYLRINSTFIRLFFVLLSLAGSGIGIFIYLLLWIILPPENALRDNRLEDNVRQGSQEIADRTRAMAGDFQNIVRQPNPQAGLIIGGSLILLGFVYLLQALDLPWLDWLDFSLLWPLLLIFAGAALLWRRIRGEDE